MSISKETNDELQLLLIDLIERIGDDHKTDAYMIIIQLSNKLTGLIDDSAERKETR